MPCSPERERPAGRSAAGSAQAPERALARISTERIPAPQRARMRATVTYALAHLLAVTAGAIILLIWCAKTYELPAVIDVSEREEFVAITVIGQ